MRFATAGVMFLLLASPLVYGEENDAATASSSLGPLDVLADCVKAIEERDFARYVDHLAEEEQRLQAGFVLFINSMLPPSDAIHSEVTPDVFLLSIALNDLVKRHTVAASEWNANQQAAHRKGQEMLGHLYSSALARSSYNPPMAQAPNRQAYRELADVLKDSRQFLIETLTEMSRPLEVSGAPAKERPPVVNVDELVKGYREAPWTLYTRGPNAIAVAAVSQGEQKDDSAGESAAPALAEETSSPRIAFQKIGGQWKITRLFPVMTLAAELSPGQASPNNAAIGQPRPYGASSLKDHPAAPSLVAPSQSH